MIKIIEHPLVLHDLTIVRDKRSSTSDFNSAMYRIGTHLAIDSMRNLPVKDKPIETPMEKMSAFEISGKVINIPVLRAGLALLPAFTTLYPNSSTGFIGLRRNENTFEAEEYYFSLPPHDDNTHFNLLEVMIATGSSTCNAINKLTLEGITNITIAAVISAPEGIERIKTDFPNVNIITAALDRGLNDKKYIIPGLGDAGDRYAGI